MAVRAGGKRYVCAGVGRSLRQAMKGSAVERAREQMGGLRGELAKVREPGMHYADFVELRVQELINEDRMRRGVKKFSAEADALAEQVRREPSWPAIAALAAAALFVVVGIVVG
jgi:predicted DNA repair protein MutK